MTTDPKKAKFTIRLDIFDVLGIGNRSIIILQLNCNDNLSIMKKH